MFNTKPVPAWDSTDAKSLRDILDSNAFQKALILVLEDAPTLLDGGDVNKTLVASGEVKGYESFLRNLFLLTKEQPAIQQAPENYPDIDDNSKWEEAGEATTTNPTS